MQIGMVGLGKMGGNMMRRLLHSGVGVVGFNPTTSWTEQIAHEEDLLPACSLDEFVRSLADAASRQDERYAARLLAALRNQFGGHAIRRKD